MWLNLLQFSTSDWSLFQWLLVLLCAKYTFSSNVTYDIHHSSNPHSRKLQTWKSTSYISWGVIYIGISWGWRLSKIQMQIRLSGIKLVLSMGMASYFHTTDVKCSANPPPCGIYRLYSRHPLIPLIMQYLWCFNGQISVYTILDSLRRNLTYPK